MRRLFRPARSALAALGLLACATSTAATPPPSGALPAVAVAPGPILQTLAVIGDFGVGGDDEAAVAALVDSWRPDAVLTVGDNNYENGEAATLDDNIGAFYHAYIAFGPSYRGRFAGQGSPTARFFPVLGNHDWRAAGARPYLDYFDLPGNGRYYRQPLGEIELFALDSDPHEPDGIDMHSPQASWLREALAGSSAVWKLVTLHHPPYSSGYHGDNKVMQWPFAEWGASAVLAGHDHHYERLTQGALSYLVLGTGGARLRACTLRPRANATAQALYTGGHGALRLQTDRAGLTVQFFAVDGRPQDCLFLPRPAGGPAAAGGPPQAAARAPASWRRSQATVSARVAAAARLR